MLEKLLLRPFLAFLLKFFFRVEITGMEHYHAAGDRVLIIANHQSYLDPPLLAAFLPEKPAYAINIYQADKWYLRWADKLVTLYRLDPSKPMSMKRLIQDLRHGTKVVLFPEGRITTSGGIMKIYEGTGLIIEKTGATVLPVRIDGAEYSKASRLSRKVTQRWFPKIRLTILPPVPFEQGVPVPPRVIYDLMTGAAFATSNYRRPLLDAVAGSLRMARRRPCHRQRYHPRQYELPAIIRARIYTKRETEPASTGRLYCRPAAHRICNTGDILQPTHAE